LGLPARNRTWGAAGHVLARGGIVGDVPNLIVIAGPNGAGKSTAAEVLLGQRLEIEHFVNADTIARGLSGYDPGGSSLAAGRIMIERLRELATEGEDFAFETTLASRSFAPWITDLRQRGYVFFLRYLWIPSADLGLSRIRSRVVQGGHAVPEDDVRRRYTRSMRNLFNLYIPIADDWLIFDNSRRERREVAEMARGDALTVYDETVWTAIREMGNGR
jgi:predicted ABC-type ATPase